MATSIRDDVREAIAQLERSTSAALETLARGPVTTDLQPDAAALRDLSIRVRKLARASRRPPCLGFFGPSQAGKSFLVGALLSHELGSPEVTCGGESFDFLKEINPAKGVESTGVVTRFTTRAGSGAPVRGFECELLGLDAVLESLATGFLVECTSPAADSDRVERCLRDARLREGPPAPRSYGEAWETVWHTLTKKYEGRHPYLEDLRRHAGLAGGAWAKDVRSTAGWQLVYSLLWGGPGHAPDLDRLLGALLEGLDALGHAERVDVGLEHVRASSDGVSVIDAACLDSLGTRRGAVRLRASGADGRSREVAVEPGILSALIAEVRLPLEPVRGSLLDHADILDFPGGRALKGINGFGSGELSTGQTGNAIEVYKRGKLTFLFERYAVDREVTALVLCSPGPTKPEAVQLQAQVESWLRIRYGAQSPSARSEVESPSLFVALTKFDMSLGALRSDNARDRWDSRVKEACVDFWGRSQGSWIHNYGGKGRAFDNMFWIRNPYADQMMTLKPGDADYEAIHQGYLQSSAVARHVRAAAEKWAAVEGHDPGGLPKSGVPLLARRLGDKVLEDVKGRELADEARRIQTELATRLRALTPSKDEAEERARIVESAENLVRALRREMNRRCSGAVFGDFVHALVPREGDLEAEVRKAYEAARPMSVRTSDRVKRVLVQVLRWWTVEAPRRLRGTSLDVPPALVESFVRELACSRQLLPSLGDAVLPYFSRATVDCGVVARVLEVKMADAVLRLFQVSERRSPELPVRLSFSQAPVAAEEGEVDWGTVDLDAGETDEPAPPPAEVVFAGSRHWHDWSRRIGDFYLENRRGRARASAEDPRVLALATVLDEVERVHVGSD